MSETTPKNPTRRRSPLGPRLRSLGFDRSTYTRDPHDPTQGSWRVRCSQCEALVINGCPCHESGCPNKRSERET